jgi:hypothetical protein
MRLKDNIFMRYLKYISARSKCRTRVYLRQYHGKGICRFVTRHKLELASKKRRSIGVNSDPAISDAENASKIVNQLVETAERLHCMIGHMSV